MALASTMFVRDHTLVEGDWNETATIGTDSNVAVVIDELVDGDLLGLQSAKEQQSVTLSVRRTLLSRTPVVGDSATVRGHAMKIAQVRDGGDGVSWLLDCVGDAE